MNRLYKWIFLFPIRTSGLLWVGGIAALFFASSCKKYLTIPLPVNSIAGSDAYASDQAAAGVLNSIYAKFPTYISGTGGMGYDAGLYTDELQNISPTNASVKAFYSNTITGDQGGVWWQSHYQAISVANTTIETMQSSSLPNRNQWLGEALFVRGLSYFYLVNQYGDVPLALTSSYQTNNRLSRAPKADVYKQIAADLKQAQGLLAPGYLDYNGKTTTDRARPNLATATALLARIYLYMGDWANAETQATALINNPSYKLEAPANVFLNTSQENIWGLLPFSATGYLVKDAAAYIIPPGSSILLSPVALSPQLINSFEAGDLRLANWVGMTPIGTPATNYYYAYKYKVLGSVTSPKETLTMLRLAEQYLIRAEARARQNNLAGAAADLNAVRTRAGLAATGATTQAGLLAAILQERRVELFTEQGHRFFDLKRTGSIDAVMNTVSPQKGSAWQSFLQYWPIPISETQQNPNLTQTPGY
jgi:hypothetical protein